MTIDRYYMVRALVETPVYPGRMVPCARMRVPDGLLIIRPGEPDTRLKWSITSEDGRIPKDDGFVIMDLHKTPRYEFKPDYR